ncbi:ATP-binding protein [Streptomyces zhihengii]|uniref:ATP-binding protein n=1 Tax=Streptomyces zhihengii TaxID=1818004 RepID=UPI003452A7F5
MPRTTTRVRPTGPPGYSRTLRREPESAASARRLVRTALSAWGLADLADDAALIVSELVSNAVRHGRRESIRVFVERPGPSRVRVGVVDFSHRLPRRGESEARSEGDAGWPSWRRWRRTGASSGCPGASGYGLNWQEHEDVSPRQVRQGGPEACPVVPLSAYRACG